MRKALTIIMASLMFTVFTMNVNAIEQSHPDSFNQDRKCQQSDIDKAKKDLENFTYTLTYAPDATDMNGDSLEGYFNIKISNLPEGYEAIFKNDDLTQYRLSSNIDKTVLTGGVYTIEFYNQSCTSVLKKINIRLPFYKTYCGVNIKCKDNPWFDGTYENSASNQAAKRKVTVNTILVIILVILILIIGGFIFIIVKRRKNNEKSF